MAKTINPLLPFFALVIFADAVGGSRFHSYRSETLCKNVSVFNSRESLAELKLELDRRNIHCSESGTVLRGKGALPEKAESVISESAEPFVRPVFEEAFSPAELRQYRTERLCDVRNTPNIQVELKRRHFDCVPGIKGRRGGPYTAEALPSTTEQPSPVDAPELFDTDVLCAWHRTNSGEHTIVDELRKRSDFTSREMDLIAEHKIGLQMSEEALRCSWGQPEEINRTVGAWGVHKQYVYYGAYIYVENGVVTSWQD